MKDARIQASDWLAGDSIAHAAALRGVLQAWAARGWLRALDVAFADFLWREIPGAPALVVLAAALASHQLGRGHPSLDLATVLDDPALALSLPPDGAPSALQSAYAPATADDGLPPAPLPGELLAGLELAQWLAALDAPALVGRGAGATPLVIVGTRLYLRRYWRYEQDVQAAIATRLGATPDARTLDVGRVRAILDALFPPGEAVEAGGVANWQKIACALAARSAFAVVTGGPGTGKTTTVVRLLALLQALALSASGTAPEADGTGSEGTAPKRALRIRLAAPTGKAAARLNAAIAGAVARLPLAGLGGAEAIRANIPVKVQTVHRLLGSRPGSRHFRHHAGNRLALDVLVIDEASMIDLEMMTAVLAALPSGARLVLLGDKDQLASVEAGALLGELCRHAAAGRYTPATAAWLEAACGERIDAQFIDPAGRALDQAVVMLRHSYRFAAASGIGRLAAAVNAGDRLGLRASWRAGYADLALLPLRAGRADSSDEPATRAVFAALVVDGGRGTDGGFGDDGLRAWPGYRGYLETLRRERPPVDAPAERFDAWARAVLAAHGRFQLLCALRGGPWGVDAVNRRVADELLAAGLIPARDGWYLGRPVLVTRNDYTLGLMNGDIGITLARPLPYGAGGSGGPGWALRVAFAVGDDAQTIKWVLPSRLQSVDTVYALSVHKAQGSEFEHAALLVPDKPSPILTRELVYTAITRARSALTLAYAGRLAVVEQAIDRRVLRASGLLAEV
jgi:exodeoxyribonuclease V alpha subunit